MDSRESFAPKSISIIGLGLMGTALAHRFLDHGWQVFVWNRTRDKATDLVARGAIWTTQPLCESEFTLISLYSSDVVSDVLTSMRQHRWQTKIVIDTTTGNPKEAESLANLVSGEGANYLEAPISGSSQQTLEGKATVIVGGNQDIFNRCSDIWSVLSSKVFFAGPHGSAANLKLVSNLILGLNRLALAEGLLLAEKLKLPMDRTLEILKSSAAYSTVMDTKGNKMLSHDYTPQARLAQHLKDVNLILLLSQDLNLSLPTSELHRQLLERGVSLGLGELDNCSIIEVLRGDT